MRYFYGGLPGMGWLLPPHKMPPEESKLLGTRPVKTSLHLALSVALQDENSKHAPLGATTSLVWDLFAGLWTFRTLVQIAQGNFSI